MEKMIKPLLFGLIFMLFMFSGCSKKTETSDDLNEKYSTYVKEAWELYNLKKFKESADKYKEAFDLYEGKADRRDRYNAACSYALAGGIDSAFFHLFRLAENPKVKYRNINHLMVDADLESLHPDERWNKLIEIVKANKAEYEVNFDKELVAILDTVLQEDQKYRMQFEETEEKYGRDSEEMKALWKTTEEADAVNLDKVKKILDEHGWLGPDIIGDEGNVTLFLVIQHADLETQEKYLPMMKDAVKNGNAHGHNLAYLEDRVYLRKGEKQIYGSQISIDPETGEHYVSPLIDPDNVDKRRAEVGLDPIQDYISNWGMTWDVKDYKKKLPEYESKQEKW